MVTAIRHFYGMEYGRVKRLLRFLENDSTNLRHIFRV